MPYPVLPPPPPPLVETVPFELLSSEDAPGVSSEGASGVSTGDAPGDAPGVSAENASSAPRLVQKAAQSRNDNLARSNAAGVEANTAVIAPESVSDLSGVSFLESSLITVLTPEDASASAAAQIAEPISSERSMPQPPSGTAQATPSRLAIANITTPDRFPVEFSSVDGATAIAPTPVDMKSLPERADLPESNPTSASSPESNLKAESAQRQDESSRRHSLAESTSEHPQASRSEADATLTPAASPVASAYRFSLDVTRDAASLSETQRLQHSSSLAPVRSISSHSAPPAGIPPLDVDRLLSAELAPLDASESTAEAGIPPLDVDRLLSEGLESLRQRSARVDSTDAAGRNGAASLRDTEDRATAAGAAALGGRLSIWPQRRSSSESASASLTTAPAAAIANSASSESSQTLPEPSQAGLLSTSAPTTSSTESTPASSISEALALPPDASEAALEAAAAQHYNALKQDLDFASAQLIEPLGETFVALYNLAQDAVNESQNERQADAVPDSSEPGSPLESSGEANSASPDIDAPPANPPARDDGILIIPVEPPAAEPSSEDVPDADTDSDTRNGIESEGESDSPIEPVDGAPSQPAAPDSEMSDPSSTGPGPAGIPLNVAPGDALELTSDRQTYDTIRRVFIAEGNVELLVRGTVLNADRVQVNLPNKIAVAQGNVVLTRGEQVLRGDRIEYNLVREEGSVTAARGEIFIPQVSADTEVTRTDSGRVEEPPLSGQLSDDQPPVETATTTGSLTIGIGSGSGGVEGGAASGDVQQLRFEADTIDFTSDGWEATNVRITNDPFSPPELEIRTERATFRRLSPTRSELITSNPRLVFDQGLSIPLFRRRFVFDENQRDQGIIQFGFDQEDRGGLFVERTFEPIVTPFASLSIRPQYFIQRALGGDTDDETPSPDQDDNDGGLFDPDSFGLVATLDVDIDTRTSLEGQLEMTSLDLEDFNDEGRGSVRLQRGVLPILHRGSRQPNYHTLTAEYSYRDRLFNGTLGFQTVQRTFGLVLTSPTIQITGEPNSQGLELTYQAAIQRINANIASERRDDLLPPPPRDNVRTSLTRYQVAAQLRRFYFLWRGTPLPATPDEGLRYTPAPVVPFIAVVPRVQGIASFYSSGDTQPILTGELALLGQFGNFSRPFADYLGFNITYRQSTEGSESPFTFDREEDRRVISGGATVQIYGPFRAGFRTSISLDEDEEFDNSFFVEYSRRTYGIVLQYNPDRETGSLTFRLSDFAWTGTPEPFGGSAFEDAEETTTPGVPSPSRD